MASGCGLTYVSLQDSLHVWPDSLQVLLTIFREQGGKATPFSQWLRHIPFLELLYTPMVYSLVVPCCACDQAKVHSQHKGKSLAYYTTPCYLRLSFRYFFCFGTETSSGASSETSSSLRLDLLAISSTCRRI